MGICPAKILLATDGSEEAELAARTAADLAAKTGPELHVVHVLVLPPETLHDPFGTDAREEFEKRGRARLDEILGRLGTYLGSTYRVLGEYEDSRRVLREGLKRFPADRALSTFLALTLYNLGECREATSTLLKNLVETTNDPGIRPYGRALAHYADRLDETLE